MIYFLTPDDNDPDKGLHLKGFLAPRYSTGEFRQNRLVEGEGTDGEEVLDPPEWYEFSKLAPLIAEPRKGGRSIKTHSQAVINTMIKIADNYPSVARMYGNILSNYGSGFPCDYGTSDQGKIDQRKGMILHYLKTLEDGAGR